MNAPTKFTKYPFIIPSLINIVILGNLIIWFLAPPSALLANCIIFTLIFLIIAKLIDVKKTYLLILFLTYALLLTLGLGTTDWDARTIWLAHAKVIYFDRDLYAQIIDGGYIGGHVDYPIGFPALAATLANVVGIWNEVFPKAALIFFLIPPLFVTFQTLQNRILEIIFLIGMAIICRSYLFNGYMDALVALYTWAIVLLIMQLEISEINLLTKKLSTRNNLYAITLISFFGVLLMLKNEGLAISIILIIFMFFCRMPFTFVQICTITLIPLIFYLFIWKIPLWKYGITNDLISDGIFGRIFQRITSLNDIKLITSYFFRYCDLFSLAFILNFFRKGVCVKHFSLPIYFIISYSAVLFFLYLSTPNDLNWHLYTSVKRALLPILLVMFGSIIFSLSPVYKSYIESR
jgi:hypothetical protein